MMMEGTTTMTTDDEPSSCIPPGFRFHPTDEELVGYYLRKKVASQKIDLDVIRDIDLYRIEPWDLQDKCRIGCEEQNEWYFFSHKDKKYPTGTRTNRATMAGFWKATGRDKAVYDNKSMTTTGSNLIGMRKTLVFYRGRAPNGHKTDWIMHEYRLESEDNAPPQEEGWVVCRAFKKRATTGQSKGNIMEGWGSTSSSTYYYDHDPTSANTGSHHPLTISSSSSAVDSNILDYVTRQAPAASSSFLAHKNLMMMCKHELEAVATAADQNLQHFVQPDDQFPQLPQLESPSLPQPILKRSSSLISLATETNNKNEDDDHDQCAITGAKKVTTDWRDLDKLVASQLSDVGDHNAYQGDVVIGPSFDSSAYHDIDPSDLGLLLFENTSGREQVPNINQLSTSDCDIGICVFNK